MNEVEKLNKYNELLDFYEVLLTDKQRLIMHYYYFDDLSLNEIAELQKTSRTAVYDMIKRCNKILDDYESKLHLVKSFEKRKILYKSLLDLNIKEINDIIEKCIETE